MELLDQKMKKIMEECKKRAKEAGLDIKGETLEYIINNRDMLELEAKHFIPTLYDHWFQEVEVIRNKWMYDVYPHNPYETTVNTRPALSFYNQDNTDWLNVMLFYHVLGHVDFFHNNIYYRNTWNDDFCGQALSDKRLIDKIRKELGPEKRWVDYVIEFALAIDNLVGFYPELKERDIKETPKLFGKVSEKIDFYFGEFLRERYQEKSIELKFYYDEIKRYNRYLKKYGKKKGEIAFFRDNVFKSKFPEFNSIFKKRKRKQKKERGKPKDILQYLLEKSEFLQKKENKWMKEVIQVVRRTSLYFQPQIRTTICNEGWASLWHERLFITDERIKRHEVDWAKVNALVLLHPRIGFNVYAVGKALFEFIEELAKKGKLSRKYQLIRDIEARKRFDEKKGERYAREILFEVRRYFDDYQLINFLTDEDFQDFLDKHKLFVAGIRPHRDWEKRFQGLAEVYIKSKKAKDFRELLNKFLYHPPHIEIDEKDGELYLNHIYEGRTLVTKYIPAVLIGLEFLWGKPVSLETTEYEVLEEHRGPIIFRGILPEYKMVRVLYRCQDKKVERKVLSEVEEK